MSATLMRRYGLIKIELQEAELSAAGTYAASVAIGEQVGRRSARPELARLRT